MPLVALSLALLVPVESAPVRLARRFTANEKLAYSFNGHLTVEQRVNGLETWIPSDQDLSYGYTMQVQGLKNDGFALVRLLQPTLTETQGETYNSAPKAKTYKLGWDYLLTLSPVNEVTEMVNRTPKKKGKAESVRRVVRAALQGGSPLTSFVTEVHRLAMFSGTLDISPPLPLEPVKIGDSWKRTVGYQPQKLSGKAGKSAVQRLDYTYTYLGTGKSASGKPVERVQGVLKLDTDLGDFIRSIVEENGQADEPGLKDLLSKLKMPLTLDAKVDFDLDPKTHMTLAAYASSEGGFRQLTRGGEIADYEERFKGRTTLDLVGRKIVPPGKKKP